MKNFYSLSQQLQSDGHRCRVAVVCAKDPSTLAAVSRAEDEGLVSAVYVDEGDDVVSCQRAVELVQHGDADILMKGLVSTDVLLRAVLRHHGGLLEKGSVLTHVACAEARWLPGGERLLVYSDVAVLPFPTQEQRMVQVDCVARMARGLGISEPRIALIHCSEHVDGRHFPYTEGYADIIRQASEGRFGPAIVDGPLDLKTALDAESLAIKGIGSPLEGRADGLVFPDIEAGNVFHKTITLMGTRVGCIVDGARVPIVLPSRADDAESKYLGLMLAAGATSRSPR